LAREQLGLFQSLAERGHQIDLIYGRASDFAEQWRGLTASMTQVRKMNNFRRNPLGMSSGVLAGVIAVRRNKPDLIYVYSPNFLLFGSIIGALTSTPVVLWLAFRGPPKKRPWAYRASFRRVKKIMAVSQATADQWSGSTLAMPAVTPVLGAIDMDYYVPASEEARRATRASLGIDGDALVVLFAGRIVPDKGVDAMVAACRQLLDVPKLKVVIVGSVFRDQHQEWRSRLRTDVDALGGLWLDARPDVLPLIQMADLAVAPSLHEAFGRSICEPLACGVPVVATNVGGIPEILSGWLADFMVDPGDADEIARKIRTNVGWRRTRPDLGERCREAVVTKLALPRFVDQIERELHELLSSEHPAGPSQA
jgi:glycosyltransferase involved in cell wall biosynthesis